MRAVFAIAVIAVSAAVVAQAPPSRVSVFLSRKADVMIRVEKQPLGPDLIDVSLVNPNYPPQLLQDQIIEFGRLLGSVPRGLRVFNHLADPKQPSMQFVSAQFAVDGVIDRDRGRLKIAPFIQAFAGAPAPYTIHGISLEFAGETASERTIRKYTTSSVRAEATASKDPQNVEYRIELLSQNPREISFPEEYTKPPQEAAPKPGPNRTPLILGLFVVAAAAGGALVYLALLRGAPQARVKSRK